MAPAANAVHTNILLMFNPDQSLLGLLAKIKV